MNWVVSQIGNCNDDESIFAYMDKQTKKLKESYPMFYHCNKDIIMNCLVILIRNIKLELYEYDDLYDQF